jgi:hypothetical protein
MLAPNNSIKIKLLLMLASVICNANKTSFKNSLKFVQKPIDILGELCYSVGIVELINGGHHGQVRHYPESCYF